MPHTPPLTHSFAYENMTDRTRQFIMAEFAANGEHNLVLTETLIREVMKNPRFVKTLMKDLNDTGTRFFDAHAPFGTTEDLDLPFGISVEA